LNPVLDHDDFMNQRTYAKMSVFTPGEIDYLQLPQIGRLATVGPDGHPHVVPVSYRFNAEEDTIDIGGHRFGKSKKYCDALQNPRVALVVDEVISRDPFRIRGIEVRGTAEVIPNGGEGRGAGFDPEMIRIRPSHIASWGVDDESIYAKSRSVAQR
jgi:pyridoxamine 5'-phosphate oxidase family protein